MALWQQPSHMARPIVSYGSPNCFDGSMAAAISSLSDLQHMIAGQCGRKTPQSDCSAVLAFSKNGTLRIRGSFARLERRACSAKGAPRLLHRREPWAAREIGPPSAPVPRALTRSPGDKQLSTSLSLKVGAACCETQPHPVSCDSCSQSIVTMAQRKACGI